MSWWPHISYTINATAPQFQHSTQIQKRPSWSNHIQHSLWVSSVRLPACRPVLRLVRASLSLSFFFIENNFSFFLDFAKWHLIRKHAFPFPHGYIVACQFSTFYARQWAHRPHGKIMRSFIFSYLLMSLALCALLVVQFKCMLNFNVIILRYIVYHLVMYLLL